MSLLLRIIHGFGRLGLSLGGFFLFAAGMSCVSIWIPLQTASLGTEPLWDILLQFIWQLGAAFSIVGLGVLILRPSLRRDAKTDVPTDTMHLQDAPGWPRLLAVYLVALPLVLLPTLQSLLIWWNDAVALLGEWGVWESLHGGGQFSGLALAPAMILLLAPFTELGAAFSFIGASALTVLLILLKSPLAARFFAVFILIQLALVLGGFLTTNLMADATSELFAQLGDFNLSDFEDADSEGVITWLGRHEEVGRPAAKNLAWMFVGYLVCLPVLFLATRKTRPMASGRERQA